LVKFDHPWSITARQGVSRLRPGLAWASGPSEGPWAAGRGRGTVGPCYITPGNRDEPRVL